MNDQKHPRRRAGGEVKRLWSWCKTSTRIPLGRATGGEAGTLTGDRGNPLLFKEGEEVKLRSSVSVSDEMGNAWAAWCEMGRPRSPLPKQLDILREAAEPVRRHRNLPVTGGRADLDLTLDRHEVTLVELTPVADETPPWWDDSRILGR
jgi:hypothetical protein